MIYYLENRKKCNRASTIDDETLDE